MNAGSREIDAIAPDPSSRFHMSSGFRCIRPNFHSTVIGTVTDESGSVVPKAVVRIANDLTGQSREPSRMNPAIMPSTFISRALRSLSRSQTLPAAGCEWHGFAGRLRLEDGIR